MIAWFAAGVVWFALGFIFGKYAVLRRCILCGNKTENGLCAIPDYNEQIDKHFEALSLCGFLDHWQRCRRPKPCSVHVIDGTEWGDKIPME